MGIYRVRTLFFVILQRFNKIMTQDESGSTYVVPKPRKYVRRSRGCAYNILILLNNFGAGDEIRTHDPNLGKVVLYP